MSAACDPVALMYAAIASVEDGKVAEVEMEHRTIDGHAETESVLTITVRREVRHLVMVPDDDDG